MGDRVGVEVLDIFEEGFIRGLDKEFVYASSLSDEYPCLMVFPGDESFPARVVLFTARRMGYCVWKAEAKSHQQPASVDEGEFYGGWNMNVFRRIYGECRLSNGLHVRKVQGV